MDQNQAINTLFSLAEKAQSRGAWTLQEAHTIWEARNVFVNPEPIEEPEPNLDDTAAE